MASSSRQSQANSLPPLRFILLLIVIFFGFSFLPRIRENRTLLITFWSVGACLSVALFLLYRHVLRTGRILVYRFEPRPVHYVQFLMHALIFAYWGWYWPEVYNHIPLILAQVVFAYILNMLLGWFRHNTWILGFGPIPIIFSTNLFMWFRDDWFILQFVMVATGVFGKEFLKWKRDGQMVHIFNPSAFGLFIFSVGLLITRNTPITWGEQIALTFHSPPNIYLEIFCVGLVVQALFSVTLVTLSAAAMLYLLNIAFTQSTGVYYFIDSNIPPAVFLGLHLLVTDPATSPRSTSGKILFGAAYGGSVFGLYSLLAAFSAPTFYDKLLCVPPLNLTVRAIDHYFRRVDVWFVQFFQRFRPLSPLTAWNSKKLNYLYMSVWILLFVTMSATGFVGHNHPGKNVAFWQQACMDGKYHACQTWMTTLIATCSNGVRESCSTVGQVMAEGKFAPKDLSEAGKGYGRACDLGLNSACYSLAELVRSGGDASLEKSCNAKDGVSCFILGSLNHKGLGVTSDDGKALSYFQKSCTFGFVRGCGRLGESYLFGEGTPLDVAKALQHFEDACRNRFGPSCVNAGQLYLHGTVGVRNEPAARARFEQACQLGVQPACLFSSAVPESSRTSAPSLPEN